MIGDEMHLGCLTSNFTSHFLLAHCTQKNEGLLVAVDGVAHGELVGVFT